jgi:3-phosphoshikimate 1-carboxyvinyltransferase
MHDLKLLKSNIKNNSTVILPASKSESNRALIIKALSGSDLKINNLSDAEDTIILSGLLDKINSRKDFQNIERLNVGAAGTVMRFLTAFLCQKKGKWMLYGSERMHQRPIKELVNALRQLGAEIVYAEEKGFPPLIIEGKELSGSKVLLNPGVSSQFVSSLLMIAPCLQNGIELSFSGKIVSLPYIEMTLKMMHYFGIDYESNTERIKVPPQKYQHKDIVINYDWSAASYFYEMVGLSEPGTEIVLKGLKRTGLQGDEIVSDIFSAFGVSTYEENDGLRIKKEKRSVKECWFDFTHCPDIAQTIVVCCAALGIKGVFKGLESLAIKETDRIMALKNELEKLGCTVILKNKGCIELNGMVSDIHKEVIINTYNDHRMAMAFAPLALITGNITIEHQSVVGKSYPKFWENLSAIGFLTGPEY